MDGKKDQILTQQIGLELSLPAGILFPTLAGVNEKAPGEPSGSNGTDTKKRAALKGERTTGWNYRLGVCP